VAWGVVAALLVVLWVRSYSRVEHIIWNGAKAFDVSFDRGEVSFSAVNDSVMMPVGFSHGSVSISKDEENPTTIFGFGWTTDDDSITAYIPFWFLVLTCAAAAILPPPLFKRFSLRTLLIATTLVALVLGLIVWLVR
jgi:hypothetical protein